MNRADAIRLPTRFGEGKTRGSLTDPTFWTTAKVRGAKVDIGQAVAFAAAHALDVHGG